MIKTIIVEDDEMIASINKEYVLRNPEFKVLKVFDNGLSALKYLNDNEVDLIILDNYMPKLNGNEFVKRLRANDNKCSIIMVTAASESQLVNEMLHLGVVDYLIKPYTYQRFNEALNKYLLQKNLLTKDRVYQAEIDRILAGESLNKELPKGLNESTLETIRENLENKNNTCASLSSSTGLSKVTVRRYLNYLIECNEVDSTVDYETGGRPKVIYKLK